jgi:hypothetical protein
MLAERVKRAVGADLRALAEELGFRHARDKTYHCPFHRDLKPMAAPGEGVATRKPQALTQREVNFEDGRWGEQLLEPDCRALSSRWIPRELAAAARLHWDRCSLQAGGRRTFVTVAGHSKSSNGCPIPVDPR